jgi:hypothetical protein
MLLLSGAAIAAPMERSNPSPESEVRPQNAETEYGGRAAEVPVAEAWCHRFSNHPEWRNLIFRQLRFGTITANAREREMNRPLHA